MQNLSHVTSLPAGTRRTTVELRNQTPFPVKIYREDASGKRTVCTMLAAYRRYVQAAVVGDELIVQLAANEWTVATVSAAADPTLCIIDDRVLRSRPGTDRARVAVDVPVRSCALFLVDADGGRKPLGALAPGHPGPVFELPVGSVIQGADPGGRTAYFWLIVTPGDRPHVFGQTFLTGLGWGVAPGPGEVALWLDLALDQAAGYEPRTAPAEPLYLLVRGDVADVSALLGSRVAELPDDLRTPEATPRPGSTPARPMGLDAAIRALAPHGASGLRSGGPILVGVKAGPGTEIGLYPEAGFAGDAFAPADGALPPRRSVRSIAVTATEVAAGVGVRVLTSLSEDYVADARGGLASVSRFRTTLVVDPIAVRQVEVSSWEDDVTIVVDGAHHMIGPDRPALLVPDACGRVVLGVDATEAGCPELLVRTDAMVPGATLTVYPDQELHERIANLPAGGLYRAGIAGAKYTERDCDQVQAALQNISKAVIHGHAETGAGVDTRRHYDARDMTHAHWILSVDPETGRPSFAAVTAEQATAFNAATSAELHRVDDSLGQWHLDFKDVTHVVAHTVSKAGAGVAHGKVAQTVSKTAGDVAHGKVARDVAKTADDIGHGKAPAVVARDTAHTAQDIGTGATRALADAGDQIKHDLVITLHFLDKTVPGLQFIVNQSRHVAAAIKSAIEMIGAKVEQLIDVLRFLFDWKDIRHTQQVLEHTVTHALRGVERGVQQLKQKADAGFARLRGLLADAKKQVSSKPAPAASRSTARVHASSPTHDPALEKMEWLLHLVMHHSADKSLDALASPGDRAAALVADLAKAFDRIEEVLPAFKRDLGALAGAIRSGDAGKILDACGGIAVDAALVLVDVLQGVVDVLFDLVLLGSEAVLAMLTARLGLPFLDRLFKVHLSLDITILGLVTLLPAIFATVAVKLATGEAPFRGVTSLAQASSLTADLQYTKGSLSILLGFKSFYTIMKQSLADDIAALDLGGGSGGGGASASKWARLVSWLKSVWGKRRLPLLIMNGAKMLYFVVDPLLDPEGTAEETISYASAVRAVAQIAVLYMQMKDPESEYATPIDLGFDALLGAVKVVCGGIMASGDDGRKGTIYIVEGVDGIMKLGGFIPDPEIAVIPALAALSALEAAAGLRFALAERS